MSDGKANGLYTFKEPVRAPYLNVITAKPFMDRGKPKGEPKFSGTVMFPKTLRDLDGMVAKMKEVAAAKWPGRDFKELHRPIASGDARADKSLKDKKKDLPFLRGNLVLDSRSKFPVALNVLVDGKILSLDNDTLKAQYASKFYGGCWIVPTVNFVAYPGQGGADGITAYFQSLLWIRDDERIGGIDQQELYKEYAGTVDTSYNPSGSDDDLPF